MKKVLVVLTALCCVGIAQAVIINDVSSSAAWYGYMNVFETNGTYAWGSPWGTADLRATFNTDGDLVLASNTNCWNAADTYWVNPDGSANKLMEANCYQEFSGLAGQAVTFNYSVLANTLPAGYTAKAFIKVFDGSWATVQETYLDLAVGNGTLSLNVGSAAAVTQVGFMLTGLVTDPASAEAATSVIITSIPEPASMALLALGGLLIRRKK